MYKDLENRKKAESCFMKRIYFSFILIFFILFSCNYKLNKKIVGTWTIDEIIVGGQNIRLDLLVNMIGFKKDGDCYLPTTMDQNKADIKGVWILTQIGNKNYIKINSSNKVFAGTYELAFENDYENKLFKMILKSDKVYLKCSKLLHDFDKNL